MTTEQFLLVAFCIALVVIFLKLRERYPNFAAFLKGGPSKSKPVINNEPRIAELRVSLQLLLGQVLQKDIDVITPAILKRDELLLHQTQGYLLEYVAGPAKFEGGSAGVSFGIGGGVRLNLGGTQGQMQPGEESLRAVDQGYIVFTSQRIIFAGTRESREWVASKISNAQGIENRSGFMLGYSTRQKLEGLKSINDEPLVWALEVVTAVSQGDTDTARSKIESEIARLSPPKD